MLRFNTFRAKRYLRSKFVEGKYLLASEATDLELEILDVLRTTVQKSLGSAVAVEDAWKVERLSPTQILIKPGEAWVKGLPFAFRDGADQLVSGAILSLGTVPAGVTISDEPNGTGKIIQFNNGATTPSNNYRVVVSAQEELITDVDDPFLKNVNITESTAQKIRLNFKLNLVPVSLQSASPLPYRDESSTSGSATNFPNTGGFASPNFQSEITITPTAAGNGELIALNPISGSEGIDGRDLELVIRNNPGIGSGNPLPQAPASQAAFSNSTLIDSNGNRFYVNAVFNDTVSTQIVIRIDKEPGQPNPEIINTKPYTLIKRDVFVTDDANGMPQGKIYWNVAEVDFNSTNGIIHPDKIVDLRNVMSEVQEHQHIENQRHNIKATQGGLVSYNTGVVAWTAPIVLVNPHGSSQSIATGSNAMVDGGSLQYTMNFSGGAIQKGTDPCTVTAFGATSTLTGAALANVHIGNVIVDSAGVIAQITNIDIVNNTVTTSPSLTANGAATIYLDSYGPGKAPLSKLSYVLAVRSGSKVYIADQFELQDGETSEIGDGVSQQLLDFMGATSEVDDSPNYTSTNFVADGDSLVEAISKLDNAVGGSAGIKVLGGGTVSNDVIPVSVPDINQTVGGFNQNLGFGTGYAALGNGWIAGMSGDLLSITLRLRNTTGATGNTVVKLFNAQPGTSLPFGAPAVTVLATSDPIDASTITSSYADYVFTFPTPFSLTNGDEYTFLYDASLTTAALTMEMSTTPGPLSGSSQEAIQYDGAVSYNQMGLNRDFVFSTGMDSGSSGQALSFTSDMYLEIKGLDYADNTIAATSVQFPNDGDVASVTANFVTGGPALAITVDTLANTPSNKIIIARREGTDIIVGTSSTRLKLGQSSTLYSQMSNQNLAFIGATDTSSTTPIHSVNYRGTSTDSLLARSNALTQAAADAQEDRSMFWRSNEPITWTGTQIEYTSNIVLSASNTRTGVQRNITVTNTSPLVMSSGDVAYIVVNRNGANNTTGTLVIANENSMPVINEANSGIVVFAYARSSGASGTVLHIPLHKQVLTAGQTTLLGASGSGSGSVKATYLNPSSATLPNVGMTSVTIDGQAGVNGDTVLFTKLLSNNNRVYQLSGVGTSIAWTPVRAYSGQFDPTDGDSVRILQGNAFADQLAVFNGTNFLVNDIFRMFDGVSGNFWEMSSLKSTNILNNTTANIFSVAASGSENLIISYSLLRGTVKETGEVYITHDGTTASYSQNNAFSGVSGVTLSASISGANLLFTYTSDNSGSAGSIKYFVKRWSDAAGGPTGIPSYSGGGGGGGTAAGSNQDIQFNNGGALAGDSRFKWDATNNALNLNGMLYNTLSSAITLNDNQASPLAVITYPHASYRFVFVEYSIVRNGEYRIGTLLITNNGTTASIVDTGTDTAPVGINFIAAISGANLEVRYTSSLAGVTGSFKYTMRKWS